MTITVYFSCHTYGLGQIFTMKSPERKRSRCSEDVKFLKFNITGTEQVFSRYLSIICKWY